MDIIKRELNKVSEYISKSVGEILPDNILTDFLIKSSKRIRSKVCLLYFLAQEKELSEDFYKIIAAGEIIHNASLLHDDVLDDAELRRGKTTIAKMFNSKISILCGDYLVSKSINLLTEIDNEKVINLFKSCIENMCTSEIEQYFLRGKIPSLEKYIDICKGKTASLFSTMLVCGADLLNVKAFDTHTFGEIFGICFQLKNDLELQSINQDKINGIITAVDIIGIEKLQSLTDNYKKDMLDIIAEFPDNSYKKQLGDLINSL